MAAAARVLATTVLAAVTLAGCAARSLPVAVVTLGSARLPVEVASTEDARQTGMQIHASPPAARGMLFVYPDAAPRAFEIKTLSYPLDVVFVSASGRVLALRRLDPAGPTTASVADPARWVVETPAGWVAAHGVRVGDRLRVRSSAAL